MFFYRKDPKLSDTENILKYMRKNPNKGYLVSDLLFISYKVPTRLNELCKKWLVYRSGTKVGERKQQFAIYSLTK